MSRTSFQSPEITWYDSMDYNMKSSAKPINRISRRPDPSTSKGRSSHVGALVRPRHSKRSHWLALFRHSCANPDSESPPVSIDNLRELLASAGVTTSKPLALTPPAPQPLDPSKAFVRSATMHPGYSSSMTPHPCGNSAPDLAATSPDSMPSSLQGFLLSGSEGSSSQSEERSLNSRAASIMAHHPLPRSSGQAPSPANPSLIMGTSAAVMPRQVYVDRRIDSITRVCKAPEDPSSELQLPLVTPVNAPVLILPECFQLIHVAPYDSSSSTLVTFGCRGGSMGCAKCARAPASDGKSALPTPEESGEKFLTVAQKCSSGDKWSTGSVPIVTMQCQGALAADVIPDILGQQPELPCPTGLQSAAALATSPTDTCETTPSDAVLEQAPAGEREHLISSRRPRSRSAASPMIHPGPDAAGQGMTSAGQECKLVRHSSGSPLGHESWELQSKGSSSAPITPKGWGRGRRPLSVVYELECLLDADTGADVVSDTAGAGSGSIIDAGSPEGMAHRRSGSWSGGEGSTRQGAGGATSAQGEGVKEEAGIEGGAHKGEAPDGPFRESQGEGNKVPRLIPKSATYAGPVTKEWRMKGVLKPTNHEAAPPAQRRNGAAGGFDMQEELARNPIALMAAGKSGRGRASRLAVAGGLRVGQRKKVSFSGSTKGAPRFQEPSKAPTNMALLRLSLGDILPHDSSAIPVLSPSVSEPVGGSLSCSSSSCATSPSMSAQGESVLEHASLHKSEISGGASTDAVLLSAVQGPFGRVRGRSVERGERRGRRARRVGIPRRGGAEESGFQAAGAVLGNREFPRGNRSTMVEPASLPKGAAARERRMRVLEARQNNRSQGFANTPASSSPLRTGHQGGGERIGWKSGVGGNSYDPERIPLACGGAEIPSNGSLSVTRWGGLVGNLPPVGEYRDLLPRTLVMGEGVLTPRSPTHVCGALGGHQATAGGWKNAGCGGCPVQPLEVEEEASLFPSFKGAWQPC